MSKNGQYPVSLVGTAHEDAKELLLQSNAGVSAEYIALSDGTVPKKIAPVPVPKKLAKSARFEPHGYRGDKSLKETTQTRKR